MFGGHGLPLVPVTLLPAHAVVDEEDGVPDGEAPLLAGVPDGELPLFAGGPEGPPLP